MAVPAAAVVAALGVPAAAVLGLAGYGAYMLIRPSNHDKPPADVECDGWKRDKRIGAGAFGEIYIWIYENGLKPKHRRAVKEIRKASIKADALRDEYKILVGLEHRHIIKCLGIRETDIFIYMNLELMKMSLRQKINKEGRLSDQLVRLYSKQIGEGLEYLHSKNIIHRDLNGSNVLLNDDESAVKIADMGIASHASEHTMSRSAALSGTLAWIPLEVASGKGGGKRSDIWSLGCTIYEMLKTRAPFEEADLVATIEHLKSNDHQKLVEEDTRMDEAIRELLINIFVPMERRPYIDWVLLHRSLAQAV